MPLGHMGINVADLEASRRFYARLMPELEFEIFLDNDDEFAYRPANAKRGTFLFFYPSQDEQPYSPDAAGLQHLAFMVRSRPEVDRLVELARGLGCAIVHEPQEWPQYPPPYYAAFFSDPNGFTIEVVCHHD